MVNHIVSGLERSGTSLMMQILYKAGFPVAYDDSRKPDESNPKGYFELFGGKIINKLMDKNLDLSQYDGKAIKITSFGLRYLPKGNYRVIYMERDIEEVAKSQEKMSNEEFDNHMEMLSMLNKSAKSTMVKKLIPFMTVSYNKILKNPEKELRQLSDFIGFDLSKGVEAIDKNLWRNRNDKGDGCS